MTKDIKKVSEPKKEKTYKIHYHFDGEGWTDVQASSREEAEEKWNEGDFDPDKDSEEGQNYIIEEVQEDI